MADEQIVDTAGAVVRVDRDFEFLLGFLPEGWEGKAKQLGALRRRRKVPDARVLLRVLLIHLAEGCSLRETAVRARLGGIIDLSDVTIKNRLECAGEWFRWMGTELMSAWVTRQSQGVFAGPWQVRVVDGTQVKEPGPTGSLWRIHYSIRLPSLACSEVHVTGSEGAGNGESFCRFAVNPGDLFLGDRGYGIASGIAHVVNGGGDVLARFAWNSLPLWADADRKFDLLAHLRTLHGTALGDWPVYTKHGGKLIAGRVCALKRSAQATEQAQRQADRRAQKHSRNVMPETLEAAGYVFVFTTVPAQLLSPTRALEFYRGRWQVELVFKRLKSILGLNHLRKDEDKPARAWIHGKLFVAILMEALLQHGQSLSPWGYPLRKDERAQPLPVAGGELAVASLADGNLPAPEPGGVPVELAGDLARPARAPTQARTAGGAH
jgi:hypothetical protein